MIMELHNTLLVLIRQNGCAKLKHWHIVETGRALLHHAKVPFNFWINAFETAVYTINRLPTPRLQNRSPFSVRTISS